MKGNERRKEERNDYFSLSPTHLETKSEDEMEKKVASTAFAVASNNKKGINYYGFLKITISFIPLARCVLPVPGG